MKILEVIIAFSIFFYLEEEMIMTANDVMKQHKKYVCLNYEMRCQLEKMLKAGISKTEISQELDISVHTINYEV